ncbi:MAG: PEGA domain-containing protein [Myxococcales bacterium]|nr:PEGA domain-containing protein [Myxococcales bacterium]
MSHTHSSSLRKLSLQGSATIGEPAPRRLVTYLALAALFVLANAIGYRIYRAGRSDPKATAKPTQPAEPPPPAPTESELARAHRVAGLAALERGEYARAVRELGLANRMGGSGGDTAELMRIAKELEDRDRRQAAEDAQRANALRAAGPPRPKPVARTDSAERRRALRRSEREEPQARAVEPEDSPPPRGLVLVTSTPQGLVVQLDGAEVDLTPARLPVDPGTHQVALLRGEKKLAERRVQVAPGGVIAVDADVSALIAPRASSAPPEREEPRRTPEPATVEPADPPEPATVEPADPPEPAEGRPPKPAPPTPVGQVYVVSPEIYGEVFINGVRYGRPPLLAKEVPAGPAQVEIRVNGTTRRSIGVQVAPEGRVTARIR